MMNITSYYEGRDLGCNYSASGSTFKVWAPTASLVSLVLYKDAGHYNPQGQVIEHSGGTEIVMALEASSGVWSIHLAKDLEGLFYMYKTEFDNHNIHYAVDPYAKAVSANGGRSAIIDLRSTDPSGWNEDIKPPLLHPTDAVLYELHVRDFSMHHDSGMSNKGKFIAFTESDLKDIEGHPLGIDHLVELGITHVHLLPVFDYKTVNELTSQDNQSEVLVYNWGYDPQNFNVPEGSYATDVMNPATRIKEFKEMIQIFHQKGIRVIMDVVYNHTYAVDDGPFEPIVPGYFYRRDGAGRLSNGSGVGNEIASERPMVRKYIKDSVRYWAEEYHVDGFRFDLVGLIDTQTIDEITKELHVTVDPTLIIYGEPWTGGESPLVQQTLKGSQKGKKFALFNDHFRHAIKGDNDGWGRGFATGESGKEFAIMDGVMGSIYDFTDAPAETINYVTVHDNLNLWDKVLTTEGLRQEAGLLANYSGLGTDHRIANALVKADPYRSVKMKDVLHSETVRRTILANGIVLTSQGIPLFQAGDEMLRSKFGDHNSYRSGDVINAIRWDNKRKFRSVFHYYKGLIELRKTHPAFRMHSKEQIEAHLEVLQCEDNVVAYQLKGHANGDSWTNIMVIYNGNNHEKFVDVPMSNIGWNIAVDEHTAGLKPLNKVYGDYVAVPKISMMVLYQEADAKPYATRDIELHYERPDGDYEGWNLWVWGTGVREHSVEFSRMENGRAVAVIPVLPDAKHIGYIIRLHDWEEKDVERDQYIDLSISEDPFHVIVKSGKNEWKMTS
ncbi:alpha-dextrin endo-1,6-alpha-glucosidase [Paenibacillus sp. IHBB 10380]|uniref:type I pullulanase n=2 Tax=Paenibacillus sp. IHBB 10380 TaxID=1566358 RepID=UPI0005CFC275|nr:type I pullulanase [Paenibacillus sp. IHBB 10380]AJS57585.1 alpha-dextrin endo-1,6-alpha-glucosidase [Paenibacillus sp. IHBB 10380]